MASVALFATNRDDEALEAIHRAAQKRAWSEYFSDPVYGFWLLDDALGRGRGLNRAARADSLVFPHYLHIRCSARLATYRAMQAEHRGDLARGFQIRRDLMRIGSTMRTQGRSFLTNIHGTSVVRTAMLRPVASPLLVSPPGVGSPVLHSRILERYCSHLQRLGQREEARWVRAEAAAEKALKALQAAGPSGALVWQTLSAIQDHWIFAQALLVSMGWWGIFSIVANWLLRTRWAQNRQPLPAPLKRGMGVGIGLLLATPIVAEALKQLPTTFEAQLFQVFVPIWLVGLASLWIYWNHRKSATWIALGGAGIMLLVLPCLSILGLLQMAGSQATLGKDDYIPQSSPLVQAGVILLVFVLPLIASLSFALASRLQRLPAGIGIVHGFRATALPMICLLLISYAGVVVATLPHEAELNDRLERVQQHEGRFIAESAGRPWPGPNW